MHSFYSLLSKNYHYYLSYLACFTAKQKYRLNLIKILTFPQSKGTQKRICDKNNLKSSGWTSIYKIPHLIYRRQQLLIRKTLRPKHLTKLSKQNGNLLWNSKELIKSQYLNCKQQQHQKSLSHKRMFMLKKMGQSIPLRKPRCLIEPHPIESKGNQLLLESFLYSQSTMYLRLSFFDQ